MSVPRLIFYGCGFALLVLLGTRTAFYPPPSRQPDRSQVEARLSSPREFGLTIAARHLDFGEVWEDSRFQWTVPIENHGSKERRLELKSACNCLATAPTSFTIPAGGKRDIVVTMDLTSISGNQPVPPLRPFRTYLQPILRDESGKELKLEHWELFGKVRKVLKLDQFEVHLGRHSELRQPIPCQRVRVTSLVPVRSVTATGGPAHFRVEVNKCREGPSDHEVTIAPKARVPVGRYRFSIQIEAELESGHKVCPGEIGVTCEIAADIQASPPQVYLGARRQGETCEEYVTLTSMTGSGFKVINYRIQADGLTIERISSDIDTTDPTFRFCQRIGRLGPGAGVAIFVVEREDGSTTEVRVPVEYHGIDPA